MSIIACSVEDCEKPKRTRGLCQTHYQRLYKTGSVELRVTTPKNCSVDDCDRLAKTRGWCARHYDMWRRNGFPGLVKVKVACAVEGCARDRVGKGYCMMHYLRSKRTAGGVGEASPMRVSGQTTCTHGDCDLRAISLHLCSKHYTRLKTYGPEGLDRISVFDPEHVVTYAGAHRRIYRDRGQAAGYACVDCSRRAQQWSYDHSDPEEMVSPDGLPYSTDIERYQPRCVSCHTIFDQGRVSA